MDILEYTSILLKSLPNTALIHSRSLSQPCRDIDILCTDPALTARHLQHHGFVKISPHHFAKFSSEVQRLIIFDISDHYYFLQAPIKSLVVKRVLQNSLTIEPHALKAISSIDSALFTIMKYFSCKTALKTSHKLAFHALISSKYIDIDINNKKSCLHLIRRYLQEHLSASCDQRLPSIHKCFLMSSLLSRSLHKAKRVLRRLVSYSGPILYISISGATMLEALKKLQSVPNISVLYISNSSASKSTLISSIYLAAIKLFTYITASIRCHLKTDLCILATPAYSLDQACNSINNIDNRINAPSLAKADLDPQATDLDLHLYTFSPKALWGHQPSTLLFNTRSTQFEALNSLLQYLGNSGYLPRF